MVQKNNCALYLSFRACVAGVGIRFLFGYYGLPRRFAPRNDTEERNLTGPVRPPLRGDFFAFLAVLSK